MAYIGIPPFGQTIRSITSTTATSGQTTFNITGGYVVGYVDVFLNGILLTPSDYTATDGLSVVLASGATTGDEFQALAYQPVSLVDTYRKSEVDSAISAAVAGVDLSSKVSKTGDTMTGALVTPMVVTDSSMNFRNRIINGDMRIDQRNAGASVTTAVGNNYNPDRWMVYDSAGSKMSVQRVADAPAGFINSQKITSLAATTPGSTDYYFDCQRIEGFNVADLAWGTASAATVTLSFWVKSSLTGSFSGAFGNTSFSRSYPFSYTISAANTWEQKTVTVAGDTTGTWATDNSTGLQVVFDLGSGSSRAGTANTWSSSDYRKVTGSVSVVGTSGATFYITGVQLEVGSVATPFERRPYGTELSLCQRYYQQYAEGFYMAFRTNFVNGGANDAGPPYTSMILYPVPMRATPSASLNNASASINSADSSRARIVYNSSRSPGQSEMIITTFALSAEL